MPTPVSTIITNAYRESNLIGLGQTPNSVEQVEALALLNGFIDSLFGAEMGENLTPIGLGLNNIQTSWFMASFWTDVFQTFVPANTRLMCNLQQAQTISLDPSPYDGARYQFIDVSGNLQTYPLTLLGNGRNILGDPSITLNTNNYNQFFFYRGDLGNWMICNDIAIDGVSPFPEEFDDFLAIGLCDRLSTRTGVPLSTSSQSRFKKLRGQFYARYAQRPQVGAEQGLLRIPSNRAYRYFGQYDVSSFQRGIPWW
jgi:hypothetical protein